MPMGKGTYGSKVGRPPKKSAGRLSKMTAAQKTNLKQKAAKKEAQKNMRRGAAIRKYGNKT